VATNIVKIIEFIYANADFVGHRLSVGACSDVWL